MERLGSRSTRAHVMFLSAACSFACTDDDLQSRTVVDVAAFEFRECKSEASEGALLTGRETADYRGLECVAWQFDDGAGSIDLVNRNEGCGFDGHDPGESPWTPSAKQSSSSALELSVEWKSEGPSACGACLHDFSVTLDDFMPADTLELTIATRSCTKDCEWSKDALVLPLKSEAAGVRCRYADRRGLFAETRGLRNNPPKQDGECESNLVATKVAKGTTLCLTPCEQDADCSDDEILKCSDGTCRLTNPW